MMECRITSVRARNGGGVVVAVSSLGENGPLTEYFPLSDEQYVSLHPQKGPIDGDYLEKIKAASALCAALCRGAHMLAVSSHSGRELQRKLRYAGVDETTAAEATEQLRERGMFHEESDAARLAERCVRKGWGPRRVLSELFAKGYGEAAQKEARAYLESVDFTGVCLEVLKKIRVPDRSDRAALQKLQASLLRRGFLPSTIREALQAYFER